MCYSCLSLVHYNPQNGETPLHVAASNGHEAIVRFLVVEGGMDVNTRSYVSIVVVEILGEETTNESTGPNITHSMAGLHFIMLREMVMRPLFDSWWWNEGRM